MPRHLGSILGSCFVAAVTLASPCLARADGIARAPATDGAQTDPAESAEPQPARSSFALRVDSGFGSRLGNRGMVPGLDLGLALGGQSSEHFAWWVAPRFFGQLWARDMTTYVVSAAVELEGVWGPLRLGGGLGPGFAAVGGGDTMVGMPSPVGRAYAHVDVVRSPGFGMFFRASFEGAIGTFGPTIALGFDLGLKRASRPTD
ncbi:MAG: hypothetical protein JST00_43160 [Deltaproteobacteria bacterium]|nr:hypothetical protein [Deltaproteobacteria bacterium]